MSAIDVVTLYKNQSNYIVQLLMRIKREELSFEGRVSIFQSYR
jgi:hypothetical protein